MDHGVVSFAPSDRKTKGEAITAEGAYKVDLQVGDYRVIVNSPGKNWVQSPIVSLPEASAYLTPPKASACGSGRSRVWNIPAKLNRCAIVISACAKP